jgi:hypothetical protein
MACFDSGYYTARRKAAADTNIKAVFQTEKELTFSFTTSLPKSYINVGFPKAGSGGIRSSHFWCSE